MAVEPRTSADGRNRDPRYVLPKRTKTMAEYFSAHPDNAIVFAFACFAVTVYLFRYVGPRFGARGDWSARDHYERNLRDGADDC